jgi:hypothetical protein
MILMSVADMVFLQQALVSPKLTLAPTRDLARFTAIRTGMSIGAFLTPRTLFHGARGGDLKKNTIVDDIPASSFGRLTWPAPSWKHRGRPTTPLLDIDIMQQRTLSGAVRSRQWRKKEVLCKSEP